MRGIAIQVFASPHHTHTHVLLSETTMQKRQGRVIEKSMPRAEKRAKSGVGEVHSRPSLNPPPLL